MIDYKELDEMIDNTWRIEDDLASIGVTREQALKLADEHISEITVLYNKYSIEKRQKATMLEDICEMADANDPEQLKLVCAFTADYGLLFGDTSGDHKIACWLRDAPLALEMQRLVTTRREKRDIMQNIAKCTKSESSPSASHYLEVFNLLAENGYADGISDLSVLKDNLADVERIINTHTGFDRIAPFVYYQALVRNSKKMLEKPDYQLNPESLFKYQKYSIDADNGKNFDAYTDYLQLYIDLIDIFPEADKELCEVCYLDTSNLGSWNYDNADAEDIPMYIDDKIGIKAFFAFDEGLNEFEFFKKNDVNYDDVADYENAHPQLWKSVKKKLDAVSGRKVFNILDNAESIVKEFSLENPIKPEDLLVFQACCYSMIADYISDYLVEKVCGLISDKPKYRKENV